MSTGAAAADIPLALYVHLPWCMRKCPYCDFNSHAVRSRIPEVEYVDALIRDLDFELRDSEPRPLGSIFFGGGTPSLFSAKSIARILDAASARLRFADDIEITLEANPGTADEQNFAGYRSAGVNRMSIGVQSFDDRHLKALGRIHGREEAMRAFDMARTAGFDNLNLDLMFALPNQSVQGAEDDLNTALSLFPEHLSWYHLTMEPNTEFALRPPENLPDNDASADIHDAGCALLSAAGFDHYETSAFSRSDCQCLHNVNYWQFGDYLGIGAGAHAKRSVHTDDGLHVQRRARHKHPKTYMTVAGSSDAIQEQRDVFASELPFEFCMNALRLHQGFSRAQFEQRSGLSFAALGAPLEQARMRGLIESDELEVRPSELGRRYQNRLFELFLS